MAASRPAISPAGSSSGVTAEPLFLGGEFGNYAARLSGSGFLEQDVATTAGQHYTLSFYVAGDRRCQHHTRSRCSGTARRFSAQTDVALGFTKYTFDVVGDALGSDDAIVLRFLRRRQRTCLSIRCRSRRRRGRRPRRRTAASPSPTSRPRIPIPRASRRTGSGYVGTFSLDPVSESGGSRLGRLALHGRQCRHPVPGAGPDAGPDLLRCRSPTDHGASTLQDVTVAIDGTNDAPTAVNETVITDVGRRAAPSISSPGRWRRTTPIRIRPTISSSTASAPSTGGSAVGAVGDVFFADDATLGGSFTYTTIGRHRDQQQFRHRDRRSTTPPRPRR